MKKIFSLLIAILMCMTFLTVAYGSGTAGNTTGNTIDTSKLTGGNANLGEIGQVTDAAANVIAALKAVGMVVGVFILIFYGFKYLTAGAGEKAKVKDQLVPFLVGALLIALAPYLASWLFQLVQ